MNYVPILLKQTSIMFILIFIGFFLKKKNYISDTGSKEMCNILIYVVVPCVLANSFNRPYTEEESHKLLIAFILSFISLVCCMIIAHFIYKKKPQFNFGLCFSNAGFIGIPLVTATLGSGSVFYAAPFVAFLSVLQMTYGVYVLTKNKNAISFKTIITNPIVLGFIIGILIYVLRISVPEIITGVLTSVSGLNSPLACIIIGVYLASVDFKSIFTRKEIIACSILRLIAVPLFTILFYKFLFVEYLEIKLALLIVGSAPIGANVVVYSRLNNLNSEDGVRLVCFSTLASILTLPLIIYIANIVL